MVLFLSQSVIYIMLFIGVVVTGLNICRLYAMIETKTPDWKQYVYRIGHIGIAFICTMTTINIIIHM